MMMLQHVPFGLRTKDSAFVDVADVARGKKCACICPSCHTPLIARQGEEKQWHFAHASRKVEGTDKECDFSFFVSVRMMARQVIETGITLDLPEYKCDTSQEAKGKLFKETFVVTKQTTISLENVQKESSFEGCLVDVIGGIKGFSFVIYFTHPNRHLPIELQNPNHKQSGILEIKLDDTHRLFVDDKKSDIRQIDKLKAFLQHDLESKAWVFHPRKEQLERDANERVKIQIEQYTPILHSQPTQTQHVHDDRFNNRYDAYWFSQTKVAPPAPVLERTATFECIMCNCTWQEKLPGQPKCPKCKSHLYASEILSR